MLRKVALGLGSAVFGVGTLFFVAGRPLSDVFGYFRAGASTTVKSIEKEIPNAVHDEKTATELAAAREQLVDRQVQLNLSQNQLKNLEHEISSLESTMDDRSRVLASAYPVLDSALEQGDSQVVFVSTNFSLNEFQHEIDDLLSMQERDENSLRIKKAGFERLKQSVAEGSAALAAMKGELLEIEQEFAVLKTRRDQAQMEADTLDLVAGATTSNHSSSASLGKSMDRLEGQVQQLEARNSARRDVAPADQRVETGRLSRSFNRLESLKKYAEQRSEKSMKATTTTANSDSDSESSAQHAASPSDVASDLFDEVDEVVLRVSRDKSNVSAKIPTDSETDAP